MRYSIVLALCCIALGVSAENANFRITGNELAAEGEFPYQVSMQLDGRHMCGGSLISKRHVLTAAHCVYDIIAQRVDKSRVKIMVGSTNVNGGTKMDVDRIARHAGYIDINISPSLNADVAVIRLKKPITESATVKTIALPSAYQPLADGSPLIVSGFGNSYMNGPTSPVLKKLDMKVVNSAVCQQQWPTMRIGAGHLCAVRGPSLGVCQGDSGGPLTQNKQVVVGIASAVSGSGCGTGIPDLFTRVSSYLEFINSELARTS